MRELENKMVIGATEAYEAQYLGDEEFEREVDEQMVDIMTRRKGFDEIWESVLDSMTDQDFERMQDAIYLIDSNPEPQTARETAKKLCIMSSTWEIFQTKFMTAIRAKAERQAENAIAWRDV